jgi:hypothetical protein
MENLLFTLGTASFPVGFAESVTGASLPNLGSSSLNLGLLHGFLFSFPFSAPILICVSRFLVEGMLAGSFAVAGTIVGQLCFLTFILSSPRSLVQFWYTVEPFLAFVGFALSFKLATDLYAGSTSASFRGLGFGSGSGGGASSEKYIQYAKILGFNFVLLWCNPAMPASSTRSLASAPHFVNFQAFSADFFVYSLVFFLVSSFCLIFVWPGMFSLLIQVLNRGRAVTQTAGSQLFARLSGGGSTRDSISASGSLDTSSKAFGSYEEVIQPRFLSFLIVGCLLSGGLQYSWRLFTQYPMEALQLTSSEQSAVYSTARQFPTFDSNIRHREKNLPVDRHLPIEKMSVRRTLSGRPPLNEEQKSDAYFKFNSFFVNTIEQKFENQLLRSRMATLPSDTNQIRTGDEIDYLQKLKTQYDAAYSSGEFLSQSSLIRPRPLENNTKGKPKFSYIRELISDSSGNAPKNTKLAASATLNPFLHDELQILAALLQ